MSSGAVIQDTSVIPTGTSGKWHGVPSRYWMNPVISPDFPLEQHWFHARSWRLHQRDLSLVGRTGRRSTQSLREGKRGEDHRSALTSALGAAKPAVVTKPCRLMPVVRKVMPQCQRDRGKPGQCVKRSNLRRRPGRQSGRNTPVRIPFCSCRMPHSHGAASANASAEHNGVVPMRFHDVA